MLPTNLNELIPEKHLVRVVNDVIEEMDLEPLMKQYKGGGTSSYHPRMMLKVLVYAYTQKEYSSRRIAKALRENINYMLLSGGNKPNFRTINRFRGVVVRTVIEELFTEVLEYLIEYGYVKVENYFIAGTQFFSGSLYLIVFTNKRWFGAIAPLGGLALIAGWVCLGLTAL